MNQNTVQGFLIARTAALSYGASAADASRIGVVSAFFPNPLAGLVVARAMARGSKSHKPQEKPKDSKSLAIASHESGGQAWPGSGKEGETISGESSHSPQDGSSASGTKGSSKGSSSNAV